MGEAFDKDWLVSADVKSIPHAFIVKDGKVLLMARPDEITEKLIQGLLAGVGDQAKVFDDIQQVKDRQKESERLIKAYHEASSKSDIPAMDAVIAELENTDPENQMLAGIELGTAFNRRDWKALAVKLDEQCTKHTFDLILGPIGHQLAVAAEAPEDLKKKFAAELVSRLEKKPEGFQFFGLSELQWSLGEKDAAKAAAKRALQWMKSPEGVDAAFPVEMMEKLSQSLEKGELPSIR